MNQVHKSLGLYLCNHESNLGQWKARVQTLINLAPLADNNQLMYKAIFYTFICFMVLFNFSGSF